MAWGASGPQWGASLTSSQYFPATANADEEGNLWADLLKGTSLFGPFILWSFDFLKIISNSKQNPTYEKLTF